MTTAPPPLALALPPGQDRRLMAGAYLGMIGVAGCISPNAVCLTSVARSFPELSVAGLGLLSTLTLLGLTAGILLSGPLADHWGMRRFMALGALVQILGLWLMALAPTSLFFLASTTLMGLGTGLVDGLTSPLMAHLRPAGRTRALNLLHAAYPIGLLLHIAAGSLLLSLTGNWRLVYPVISLWMTAALVLYLLTPFPRHEGHGAARGAVGRLLPQGAFWVAFLAIFLAGSTDMAPTHWTPAFAERVLGWTRSGGAALLFGFSAAMMLGRLLAGGLAPRLSQVALLALCFSVCLVTLLVAALGPPLLAAAALLLFGLAVAPLWPTLLAFAADRVTRGGATMFSLLIGSGNLGAAFSPSVVGFIAEGHGLRFGFASIVVFPLLALLLLAAAAFFTRRSAPAAPLPTP